MTVAGAITNYSYDDASRLATVTSPSPASATSYTWDNNGDLTARGSDSFGWDYEGRMSSATVGATSYSYTYRGDGLRNSATTGGVTKTFTWDVNAGLPVVLDDGAQYVYGNGLISQVAGANTYYYLSDGLGSTLKTTDASGAVVNAYTYDVYGKTTSSSGSQSNDIQFAGQQTDPTGLQYLRARYYDPETGGLLSRDPLSALPGWSGSPFGHAGANPASRVDPSGLRAVDADGCEAGNVECASVASGAYHACSTPSGQCPSGASYCPTLPQGMAMGQGACPLLIHPTGSGYSLVGALTFVGEYAQGRTRVVLCAATCLAITTLVALPASAGSNSTIGQLIQERVKAECSEAYSSESFLQCAVSAVNDFLMRVVSPDIEGPKIEAVTK